MAASHRAPPRFERHGSTSRATIAAGIQPARSKTAPAKRSVAASYRDGDEDLGRVRVAVRLRPKSDADIADNTNSAYCIELLPEMKRLKLKRNNWSSESYRFDEVLTENASQKRVYEVVASPVVESVLNGYNGTVMAYGQTGTGKTYTLGNLGRKDPSERGIMVRAMEEILANISPNEDTVAISYLQLYLESIQDLLDPEKNNILMAEDPKTGEVSLPAASVVVIKDINHFLQLLQIGEANRHASNTKLNTESSRSHAILMIHIHRSRKETSEDVSCISADASSIEGIPVVLKSKLLIVDLAGSERINKSGCEGQMLEETKFINLSLSSLGKCINALAENSPHIPIRDSKLTRLLRDSFGGSARTSLIITISQSVIHHAETSSTIMFGQRAMKVVNVLKLKEEVDYESLCRKLESEVDNLSREIEKTNKLRDDEKDSIDRRLKEHELSFNQAAKSFSHKFESLKEENLRLQLQNRDLAKALDAQKIECHLMKDEIAHLRQSLDQSKSLKEENIHLQSQNRNLMEALDAQKIQCHHMGDEIAQLRQNLDLSKAEKMINELRLKLDGLHEDREIALTEISTLTVERDKLNAEKISLLEELKDAQEKLSQEVWQRRMLEEEFGKYKKLPSDRSLDLEAKLSSVGDRLRRDCFEIGVPRNLSKSSRPRESSFAQKDIFSKIIGEVGLGKVLDLLQSGDLDLQIQAVKVVANLAAEDNKQKMIVEDGGLDALLMLLGSSQEKTVLKLTAAAIANLAMNSENQGLIVSKGGGLLLAGLSSKTEDPQTLRMAAGAIANLCGNEMLLIPLKKDGVTKALLEMSKFGHMEIITQIARGIANFAKCETRERSRGRRKGRSLLIDDGAFLWIISNSTRISGSARRHIELALCHLAQNGHNARDLISSGAVTELVRISEESLEEDIREFAKKILKSNSSLSAYMR